MTNKEIIRTVNRDKKDYYFETLNNKQIHEIFVNMQQLLHKDNNKTYTNIDITQRQITCIFNAIRNAISKNFNRALHELLDAIDNYNEQERLLTQNEILIYNKILELFIEMINER